MTERAALNLLNPAPTLRRCYGCRAPLLACTICYACCRPVCGQCRTPRGCRARGCAPLREPGEASQALLEGYPTCLAGHPRTPENTKWDGRTRMCLPCLRLARQDRQRRMRVRERGV